ncbi:phosphatidate cytidylyltransferase [Pontiella sulfatireligans]|uniref:Phosphatidate cytidylyltransferase n=1 Tax=Pontiella sulfatireligans TaxID=2750658 RepID=A0A6C2UUD1_9BACT|nr:phosphatidate cytidylyltransferase [Pontiella sulfatireligans]VGO22767.1 Phosphatidate cytidylyltransferase [Pontiella sulfatireligans]
MDKKRIIIALSIGAVLIPIFCLVPCSWPIGLIGMLLFAGVGTWEFYGLLNAGGIKTSTKWGIASGLLFVAATWFNVLGQHPSHRGFSISNDALWCILLIVVISNFFRILTYPNLRKGLESCMGTILGIVYVPLLWSFVVRLFLIGDLSKPGWAAFYVILCMKMADSGGYFFGTRFGKHKLAPTISPKKSWEGLFGGIVFCVAVNLIWVIISSGNLNSTISLPLGHAIALGILFPIVGTLGDLVESMFKRAVDVKDSNTMVYGLGGILDMVDSILFAAPMLYIYIELFLK